MTNGCPAGGLDSPRRCRDCDISGHGDIGRLHYRDNDIPSYEYCDRLCRWSVEVAIRRLFQQTEVRKVQILLQPSSTKTGTSHWENGAYLRYDYHFLQSFCIERPGKSGDGFVTLYICSFAIDQGNE